MVDTFARRTSNTAMAGIVGLLAVAVLAVPARACPTGTVFSAYKGNGICAYVGQGAKAAVQCTVAKGTCPVNTTREKRASDPKNSYCCSTQIKGKTQCHVDTRFKPPLKVCDDRDPDKAKREAAKRKVKDKVLTPIINKNSGAFGTPAKKAVKAAPTVSRSKALSNAAARERRPVAKKAKPE